MPPSHRINQHSQRTILFVGIAIQKVSIVRWIILSLLVFLLCGCASSGVEREAASSVDLGVNNAKNVVGNFADGDVASSYQNASQATKGAIIGGAAGALTGSISTIGILPATLVGGIFGASYGAYIDSTTNKRDRLENRGVSIIVLGDQVLIVVPSARIFDEMTAHVKLQAYSTLEMIARYVNRYTKMTVKVSGYTDNSGNAAVDLALSKQQADAVARCLLTSGISSRLLYAEGRGGTRLVEPSGHWDSDNYRIEITFEKLYV